MTSPAAFSQPRWLSQNTLPPLPPDFGPRTPDFLELGTWNLEPETFAASARLLIDTAPPRGHIPQCGPPSPAPQPAPAVRPPLAPLFRTPPPVSSERRCTGTPPPWRGMPLVPGVSAQGLPLPVPARPAPSPVG